MSLQFIVGPSGSGKTKLLQEQIIDRAEKLPNCNMIIMVPEQFNISTAREIVNRSPKKGIMNIDVLSFNRMAHRIFDEAGGNHRKILDDTGKTMILRHLAAIHRDELTILAGKLDKSGYINEVKSVLSEFMQYQIGPSDLQTIISNNNTRPNLNNKLSDLHSLYQWFIDFMGQRYITMEEYLEAAADMADKAAVLKNAEVYLDGYTGFTPVQYRFLQVLMAYCKRVVVTVTLGREMYSEEGLNYQSKGVMTDLFAMGQTTIYKLYKIANKTGVTIETPITIMDEVSYRLKDNKALSHLEKVIFRTKTKLENSSSQLQVSTGDLSAGINVCQADTPITEVSYVCRRIHELVRTGKYRYSDFAILTGSVEDYNSLLKKGLEKYNIPYFEDIRHKSLMNPLSELVKAVVELHVRNFSYESVFRLLKCGLLDISEEEIDKLDNYVQAAGIRYRAEYFKPFTRMTRDIKEQELEEINEIRERFANTVAGIADKFPPKKKVKCIELLKALYEFLAENRVYSKMLEKAEYFKKKDDFARSQENETIYDYLMTLLDSMANFLGDEMLSVREFGEIIEAGLGEMSVGILPPFSDQVLVGDIKRSRLAEIKILFLMGVNDGMIPADERKTGILSEADRQILKEQEIELSPDTREQSFVQRFYLYMYLTKASDELYLSYSQIKTTGESIRPSYLIGELKNIFEDLKVTDVTQTMTQARPLVAREGLDYISRGLRDNSFDVSLFARLSKEDNYRNILENMYEHAFREYRGDHLSSAVAMALYGNHINASVTRLEKFAKCAYSHFVQYGLKLKEKEQFSFEAADVGSLYHSALELFGRKISQSSENFLDITQEAARKVMSEAIDECLKEIGDSALYDNSRNLYVQERMKRVLERTAEVLVYQLQKGDFVPENYELTFGRGCEIKGRYYKFEEDKSMTLEGKIDRVDCLKKEDRIYVKILDYKSGNNKLKLAMLYEGLSLQLMVYLDTAVSAIKSKNRDKEVIKAGVLYYHMDDPIVDREYNAGEVNLDNVEQKIRETLRMAGYVNSDLEIVHFLDKKMDKKSDVIPVEITNTGAFHSRSSILSQEQLGDISRFVDKKVCEISTDILSGNIRAYPYKMGEGTYVEMGCTYCGYKDMCGFDVHAPGYEFHDIEKIDDSTILEKMKEDIES